MCVQECCRHFLAVRRPTLSVLSEVDLGERWRSKTHHDSLEPLAEKSACERGASAVQLLRVLSCEGGRGDSALLPPSRCVWV